jgi:hypothetical protein
MAMAKEVERVGEAGGDRRRKKTLGRQKIEMKPIQCPEARHVCFSKRRVGLLNKATELSARSPARSSPSSCSPRPPP